MRVLILNWTAGFHAGCRAVCESLESLFEDHEIVGRVKTRGESIPAFLYLEADMVVLNGEGTCHHNASNAVRFLRALEDAQDAGLKTMLLNTVWQDMEWFIKDDVAGRCDLVTAREPMSQGQLPAGTPIYPDLCLSSVSRPSAPGPHEGQVVVGRVGSGSRRRLMDQYPGERVLLEDRDFQDVVDELSGAALYLTSQYHGMYAAAAAGVPCSTYPSNSWKVESTLDWYERNGGGKSFSDWLWELPRLTKEVVEEALR